MIFISGRYNQSYNQIIVLFLHYDHYSLSYARYSLGIGWASYLTTPSLKSSRHCTLQAILLYWTVHHMYKLSITDNKWNYVHTTFISRLMPLRRYHALANGEEVFCSLNYVAEFGGHRYAKLPERTMQRCWYMLWEEGNGFRSGSDQ